MSVQETLFIAKGVEKHLHAHLLSIGPSVRRCEENSRRTNTAGPHAHRRQDARTTLSSRPPNPVHVGSHADSGLLRSHCKPSTTIQEEPRRASVRIRFAPRYRMPAWPFSLHTSLTSISVHPGPTCRSARSADPVASEKQDPRSLTSFPRAEALASWKQKESTRDAASTAARNELPPSGFESAAYAQRQDSRHRHDRRFGPSSSPRRFTLPTGPKKCASKPPLLYHNRGCRATPYGRSSISPSTKEPTSPCVSGRAPGIVRRPKPASHCPALVRAWASRVLARWARLSLGAA